jgi:tubulin epsilon
MGGGTGSGLGTRILSLLEDDYPEVFRFSTVVFPEDDVVTGPYNSILALNELSEHADCVLPIDNSALYEILGRIEKFKAKGGTKGAIVDSQSNKKSFD